MDTSEYYFDDVVSFGVYYTTRFLGFYLDFEMVLAENNASFNHDNLFMCQILSLRGSSFSSVDVGLLYSLLYIDIALS